MSVTRRRFFEVSLGATAAIALAVPAAAEEVLGTGAFSGVGRYTTTGGVTVVRREDGRVVVRLGENFFHSGSPDPHVGLGLNGRYDDATTAGLLRETRGAQEYVLPAGVDGSQYNEVYIWCRRFSVPLGVARLS